MTCRDPRHERLLEALWTSDQPAQDPAARELEACPICRVRLLEMRAVAADLSRLGDEQRAVLASASRLRGAAGEDLVASLVRANLPGGAAPTAPSRSGPTLSGPARPGQPRPGRRWWLLPAIALAAVALLTLLLWRSPRERPALPADRTLGTQADKPWPSGDVGDAILTRPFTWPGRPGDSYVVHLYADGNPLDEQSFPCATNQWQPEPSLVKTMRDESVHWVWYYETRPAAPAGGERTVSEPVSFTLSR